MITVDNNNISLTRGDSGELTLTVEEGGQAYDYSGDAVVFGVKRNFSDNSLLIEKTVTDGKIVLEPEDTVNLTPGLYYYDVRVVTVGGDVATVIAAAQLNVGHAVINGTVPAN